MVVDHLFQVPCKIIHSPSGSLGQHFDTLVAHFRDFGTPVMMGGDVDASSKGIFGAAVSKTAKYLLVVDPHYWGPKDCSAKDLQDKRWVRWKPLDEFSDSSFYNMCLPQIKSP